MYLLLADLVLLINMGVFEIIQNAMMRLAKAISHPDAKDKYGDVKPAVRERLRRFEVEPTWCKPSAYAFSILYRKKSHVPGSNSSFAVPSGYVRHKPDSNNMNNSNGNGSSSY